MSDARNELLAACKAMDAVKLSPGTSGNLSVRDGDGYWITPSGSTLRSAKCGPDGVHGHERRLEWRPEALQ